MMKLVNWVALGIAIVFVSVMSILMVQKTNAITSPDVTVEASGYVIDAPDIEGQEYFTQPDGTITITLK